MSDDLTAEPADDLAPFARRRRVRLLIRAGIAAVLVAVIVIIVAAALANHPPPGGSAIGEPVPCPAGSPIQSMCVPGNNNAAHALDTLAQSGEYRCQPFSIKFGGPEQLSCTTDQTKVTGDPTLTDGTAFT